MGKKEILVCEKCSRILRLDPIPAVKISCINGHAAQQMERFVKAKAPREPSHMCACGTLFHGTGSSGKCRNCARRSRDETPAQERFDVRPLLKNRNIAEFSRNHGLNRRMLHRAMSIGATPKFADKVAQVCGSNLNLLSPWKG